MPDIKVLVADDWHVVRAGPKLVLEQIFGFELIAGAADGRTSVRLYTKFFPDAEFLEMRMPGLDNPVTTAAIIRQFSTARITLLNSFEGGRGHPRRRVADQFDDIHRSGDSGCPRVA